MSIFGAWSEAGAGCCARPANEPTVKMSAIKANATGSDAASFIGFLLSDEFAGESSGSISIKTGASYAIKDADHLILG
jgi:hypothetical protein